MSSIRILYISIVNLPADGTWRWSVVNLLQKHGEILVCVKALGGFRKRSYELNIYGQ
jgi:hypothetical protein